MAKGGYRKPQGPRPKGGPGKMSEREDANQPVRTPGLDDPDMQYGDVGKTEDSLKAAPLPNAAARSPRPPQSSPPAGAGGGIPLDTSLPTNRPGEPPTAGLDIGAGDGSSILRTQPEPVDDRERVLDWLVKNYQNKEAAAELQAMRTGRATQAGPMLPGDGSEGLSALRTGIRPAPSDAGVEPGLDEAEPSGLDDPGELDLTDVGGSPDDPGAEDDLLGDTEDLDAEPLPPTEGE